MTIREAVEADIDALLNIYHGAYRENRQLGFPAKAETATSSDVETWLNEEVVYVAVDGDDVVGAVRAEETEPDRVKVSRLAVRIDHQGRGIASELLDHVETVARSGGAAVTWLTTPSEHPYLPELYRRRGYEKAGDYPLEYREYDEIVMEKRLDEG